MASHTGVYLHSHTHTEQNILLFIHSCRTDAAVTASGQGPTGGEVREVRGATLFRIQVEKMLSLRKFRNFLFLMSFISSAAAEPHGLTGVLRVRFFDRRVKRVELSSPAFLQLRNISKMKALLPSADLEKVIWI